MNFTAVDAAAKLLGALAERDAPLGARTTYRVGGTAALLLTAHSEADLRRARTAVLDRYGRIDALVGAQGIFDGMVPLMQIPVEKVEAVFEKVSPDISLPKFRPLTPRG